jgi:hypothetical protein
MKNFQWLMSVNPGNIVFKAGQSLDNVRLYHESSHSSATIASTADSDGVAICLTHITAIFFYCYDFSGAVFCNKRRFCKGAM